MNNYSETAVGIEDSSGDWEYTKTILAECRGEKIPSLSISA